MNTLLFSPFNKMNKKKKGKNRTTIESNQSFFTDILIP